jgi:hypothetical protein
MASPHRRRRALAKLLDDLVEERGSLDTPEGEAEIARYMRLLDGVTGEPGELQSSSVVRRPLS